MCGKNSDNRRLESPPPLFPRNKTKGHGVRTKKRVITRMKAQLYTLKSESRIENYQITRVLGIGGFGITYHTVCYYARIGQPYP